MGASITVEKADLPGLKKYLEELCGRQAVAGVEIGIFEDATNEQTGERIAPYAADNEFGTKKIPRRPFLGQTFKANAKKYANIIKGVITSNIDDPDNAMRKAFSAVGRVAQTDVVQTIKSNMPPTDTRYQQKKRLKKGAEYTTLIDTASMVKSIGFRLTDQRGGHIE